METAGIAAFLLHTQCRRTGQHGGDLPGPQIRYLADGEGPPMRIEFLTQEDSLYILPFFEEFLRHYPTEFEITRISCCRAMGKRSRFQLLRELMWLYGMPGLAKLLLQAGVAEALAVLPRGRSASRFYSIAQLAKAHGIPFRRRADPNSAEIYQAVQ